MRLAVAGAVTLLLAGAAAGQTGGDEPLSETVKPGAPLDPSGFRYERRLPESAVGLVTLVLDAPALAHSQGPFRRFADVRILDEKDAQIPYILEPRPSRLALDVEVARTAPRVKDLAKPGGARSFYAITLPYEGLPQPVLMLDTSEHLFLRSIELGVQRAGDRRHKTEWLESLVRTSWQHANPTTSPPPLEIPFPQQRGRELLLIVEEGDNQPLPITRMQVLLPGWQLRFFRPSGPLRLLYGQADLNEPQYDVARLSPSVMSGPAREIVAAPEATVSRPAALLTPQTFWVGLSLAVVVLLGLIVRLISTGTAPPPSPPGP